MLTGLENYYLILKYYYHYIFAPSEVPKRTVVLGDTELFNDKKISCTENVLVHYTTDFSGACGIRGFMSCVVPRRSCTQCLETIFLIIFKTVP